MNINRVVIGGHLGADPVVRETASGEKLAYFSVATSRRKLVRRGVDRDQNEYRDQPDWHRVIAWGRLAEKCRLKLRKGSPVVIEGNIRVNTSVASNPDERPRRFVEIEADKVHSMKTEYRQETSDAQNSMHLDSQEEIDAESNDSLDDSEKHSA